jgi:HlyD family secretion protein
MNKKIIFFIVVLIGFIITIISFKNNKKEIPNESPKYRDISNTNFFLGKFKPLEMVEVQPIISGIIDSVYVEIGDRVSINDRIAKLRIIPIPQEIERTKRALQIALADLKQKKIDYNRNKSLFDKGVIAKVELEKIKLELDFAEIEYSNAQNNFNIALTGFSKNANESPNIIRSTINGKVLNVLVKKGQNVTERNTFNNGSTIAVLVNSTSFIYEFEIAEIDIASVSKGDDFSISIKALNNRVVNAKIKELKPLIKKDNNFYYLASAIILDSISELKPGFTGLAEFVLQQKTKILSIKEKNIIYKNRKSYIEIIKDDETINEIEIKVGISDGIYTEIISGITKKDKIKIQ